MALREEQQTTTKTSNDNAAAIVITRLDAYITTTEQQNFYAQGKTKLHVPIGFCTDVVYADRGGNQMAERHNEQR